MAESKSKALHENLDTTFVNLWALLRNLSQRGFIGRVHVELKDYAADVFLTGSNTPLVHEIDRAAGTETLEEAALHRLVLRARETPGTISVFEGADEAVSVQSLTTPWSEAPAPMLSNQDESHAASPIATPSPISDQSESEELEVDARVLNNSVSDEDRSASSASNSEGEGEWSAIVTTSGELIGAVERAVTAAGADFNSLFRATRLELADDYDFLDPISEAFTYSNAVVTLNRELPRGPYVSGLSEALRRVVERVAVGERARRVRERVALELLAVARKRNDLLERSGFSVQLDRIAGTKVQ
jgi:hypothetical protein